MGAMPEEIESLLPLLTNRTERSIGGRIYYAGELHGKNIVMAFSRWGKVAAASTATTMLQAYGITDLLFTGVAGAIDANLKTGDIVIAEKLIQHDLDARPIMAQHEIPLLGKTWIETDPVWRARLTHSVNHVINQKILNSLVGEAALKNFDIHSPGLYTGEIASGDQFFRSKEQKLALQQLLPHILCVEMEGAAVAQVCYENDLRFAVVRTISDASDEKSVIDFPAFINKIASHYTVAILDHLFRQDW